MTTYKNIIADFYKNIAPSEQEFSSLVSVIDFKIPKEYLELLKHNNGFEGSLGEKYFALWNINDVIETNSFYLNEDRKFYENFFIFGSNSGIFHYAFDKKDFKIIELDLYDETYTRFMGFTIEELILKISSEK